MKKAYPTAIPNFLGISFLLEKFRDFLLQRSAGSARANLLQRKFLRLEHRMPELALSLTGLPFDDGPRQITIVTRFRMLRENVQNDQ